MPGSLMRSKSMRMLKGYLKDYSQQQRDPNPSIPRSDDPQTDNDRYRSAAPNTGIDDKSLTLDKAVRPSTSGGQSDRRVTLLLKPDYTPSIQSQKNLSFLSPSLSSTVLYATEVTDSREGIIGIALGSPTVGSHWNLQPQTPTSDTDNLATDGQMSASGHSLISPTPTSGRQTKTKLNRWKSLFRRAGPTPPEKPSFYQLTQPITATRAARADSHQNEELGSPLISGKERAVDHSQQPSTYNLVIPASRKAGDGRLNDVPSPLEQVRSRARACTAEHSPINPRASIQRSATTPTIFTNDLTTHSTSVPQVVVSKSGRDIMGSAPGERPLLDISIPDTKMDRYSVMFGNLLQPTSDRTSLLVRRQGNAEKVKPLNSLSVKDDHEKFTECKLQRRATSPVVPSPSPRLSLFPNTSNSCSASPSRRPLHRSRTAPEKSPLRRIFNRNEEEIAKGRELFLQRAATASNIKGASTKTTKPQRSAITPASNHTLELAAKPVAVDVAITAISPYQALHADETEEMHVTHPISSHQTPSRTDSQQHQAKINALTALRSHPASASASPIDIPSPLQRISSLRSPPPSAHRPRAKRAASETREVGVARSVSVSRAMSPRVLVGQGGDMGVGERFVERQVLTPTMVEVRNRRSVRVQLEDV